MKIRVQFKTPDALDYALYQDFGAEEDSWDDEKREKYAAAEAQLEKYIQYREYVILEFDTELGTVTVVPVNQ